MALDGEKGALIRQALIQFGKNIKSDVDRTSPFNKNVNGRIVEVNPDGYTVEIQTRNYPNVKAINAQQLQTNDIVACCIPNNQMSQVYILGKLVGNISVSASGDTMTDMQVNGVSVVNNGVGNIVTKGVYNATTNKIATESDIPSVSLNTTTGSEAITVGGDTLSVVTRDTAQSISGEKTFEGIVNAKNITYRRTDTPSSNSWLNKFRLVDSNNEEIGSVGAGIGTNMNAVQMGVISKSGSWRDVRIVANGLSSDTPSYEFRADADNVITLGKSDTRWKDYYGGGNIYLGETNAVDKSIIFDTNGTARSQIRGASSGLIIHQAPQHYFRVLGNTNQGVIIDPTNKNIRPEQNGQWSLGTNDYRFSSAVIQNGIFDYGAETSRGVDANSNYAGCFLVAYCSLNTYAPASARIIVEDWDTYGSNYELWVNAYFGFDSTNNVKTYMGRIGVVNSMGGDSRSASINNFFLVMRTNDPTSAGNNNRVEIWYKSNAAYSRYKFKFDFDYATSRSDNILKWTKVRSTHATDQGYVSANTIAYLDSAQQMPTFIPSATWDSWVSDATSPFPTSTYSTAKKFSNYIPSQVFVELVRSYASVPNIDALMRNDSYNTTPSSTQGTQSAQFLARDSGGNWMGGMRFYHTTGDKSQTQLIARSPKTPVSGSTTVYSSGVMLEQDASATANNQGGKCRFIPFSNGTMDLGSVTNRWRDLHISGMRDMGATASGYCSTAANTVAKTVTISGISSVSSGNIFLISIINGNTVASALTMNISSTGAKPIYINNSASSSSNYTLNVGWHVFYYNGTNYYTTSYAISEFSSGITVKGNTIVPMLDSSYDLGSSAGARWRNVYSNNVYASSDRRLKENIKDNELDCKKVIEELKIKEFNFISDEDKKVVVGAIAQELIEILPEKYRATLVCGSEDTSYSINEGKLLYVAIGALKDEQKKTKELEERLSKIEKLLGV